MMTLFSVHEARGTGILTVFAAVLAYSNRGEAHILTLLQYYTVTYTVFLDEFIIRSCAPA